MTGRRTRTRFLIAGGGTAGHLLPGIAIAEALEAAGVGRDEIAFAGGDRGVERELVGRAGYDLTELAGRGVQRHFALSNLRAIAALIRGLGQGVGLVKSRDPDVVLILGGYASFACGVGAVIWRRKLVSCEQNARAGAVNRVLRWFTSRSVVAFEDTDLPRATVTGNPLRAEVVSAVRAFEADPARTRAEACAVLALPTDRIVLLVATGSLGARSVNEAVRGLVELWRDRDDLAIRHVIGRRDYESVVASPVEVPDGGLVYQRVEYEQHMGLALSAADVTLSRAGGGVAELAAFGIPAVLVPLPIAPRRHQHANARQFVRIGGAELLEDAECSPQSLADLLGRIIDDDGRRAAMSAAMRSAAHVDAAERAARVLLEVAGDD